MNTSDWFFGSFKIGAIDGVLRTGVVCGRERSLVIGHRCVSFTTTVIHGTANTLSGIGWS